MRPLPFLIRAHCIWLTRHNGAVKEQLEKTAAAVISSRNGARFGFRPAQQNLLCSQVGAILVREE